jgi:hypothetical protein
MSDPKPSIMAGPQLGICDVHPGVHTFRNDPSPCIGWMDYEPFQIPASDSRMLSPGDRPEAVSELEEDCEHGVFLSTGVKGIWRCTVCDQRATLAEVSELDDEGYTQWVVTATITLNFDSRDGLVTSEDQAREEMAEYIAIHAASGEFDITVTTEDTDTCDRHGGDWGSDPTCELCTDEEGNPR